jgi:sec-independent protein translocase protein TatB
MIGGLSMTEVIIILGLALLLLGPDQLPQLAKSIGKGLREIRKATDDLKGQFEQEIARVDLDEKPHAMIAPVPTPAADPAEARAIARNAASAPPAPAPAAPADPGEARAAARRAAAESAKLKLVAPEGAVPREEPASPAAEHGSAQHPESDS